MNMSNYRKSSKRRKIPDPNLVEIKSKFDAEFRRFSVNRSKLKKFGDFRDVLLSFFKLDTPFTVCYTDPIHGDLLPINNDENFCKALSSVGANVLLRIILQRQEEDLGQLTGYGNATSGANKKKNRLSQYILGVPSYILNNNSGGSGINALSNPALNQLPTPGACNLSNGHYTQAEPPLPPLMAPNGGKMFPPRLNNFPFHNGHQQHHFRGASAAAQPILIGRPQDFRTVSSIIDVDLVPETQRRVRLVKPPKVPKGSTTAPIVYDDRPLGFYIREGTSIRVTPRGLDRVPGIFVSRLVPGGIAASTGLLAVDDEVLEVNGISVDGRTLDQVTDMMIANASDLILTVKPANQANTLRHANRRRTGVPQGPTRAQPSSDGVAATKASVKKNFLLDHAVPTTSVGKADPLYKYNENVYKPAKDVTWSAHPTPKPQSPFIPKAVASNATPYANVWKEGGPKATALPVSFSSSYNSGGSGSSGSTPSISQYYTTSEDGRPQQAVHVTSAGPPPVSRDPPPIPPRPSIRGRPCMGVNTPPGTSFEHHQPTPPPRRQSAAPPVINRSRVEHTKGDIHPHERKTLVEGNGGKNHLFRAQSPKIYSKYGVEDDELFNKHDDRTHFDNDFDSSCDSSFYYYNGADDNKENVKQTLLEKNMNDAKYNVAKRANNGIVDPFQEYNEADFDKNKLNNGDSSFFLQSIDQNDYSAPDDETSSKHTGIDDSEMDDDDVIVYEISPSPTPPRAERPAPESDSSPASIPKLLNKTIKFSPNSTSRADDADHANDLATTLSDLDVAPRTESRPWDDEYHLVTMRTHVNSTPSRGADDGSRLPASKHNGDLLPMPLLTSIGGSVSRPSVKKRAPKPPMLCSKI